MRAKTKKAILYLLATIGVVLTLVVGYVTFFLPNVKAASYLEVERSPERIARGEYLANNVAVCMDCHSARDWSRYSAPLVPGTLGQGGEYFGPENTPEDANSSFPTEYYVLQILPPTKKQG